MVHSLVTLGKPFGKPLELPSRPTICTNIALSTTVYSTPLTIPTSPILAQGYALIVTPLSSKYTTSQSSILSSVTKETSFP